MPYHNINAQLNSSDLQLIMNRIQEIKNLLPFLINLTPEESRKSGSFLRLGYSFYTAAYDIANQRPELLPPAISMSDWKADMELLRAITPIKQQVEQLLEALTDTQVALTVEVTEKAVAVRNVLKAQRKSQAQGIDEALAALGT